MKSVRHVLCATDLARGSRRVVETAATLARPAGATLTIMHVLAMPVVPPGQDLSAVTMDRLQKRGRAWAIAAMQTLSARTTRAGIPTTLLLRDGEPAEQIIRAGRAMKADLIVMGTHGRRGLARLFLGSVAQRVVTLSPCAVVTVRGGDRSRSRR
jgi:nucleotide-binding universal stress UspA family protein